MIWGYNDIAAAPTAELIDTLEAALLGTRDFGNRNIGSLIADLNEELNARGDAKFGAEEFEAMYLGSIDGAESELAFFRAHLLDAPANPRQDITVAIDGEQVTLAPDNDVRDGWVASEPMVFVSGHGGRWRATVHSAGTAMREATGYGETAQAAVDAGMEKLA